VCRRVALRLDGLPEHTAPSLLSNVCTWTGVCRITQRQKGLQTAVGETDRRDEDGFPDLDVLSTVQRSYRTSVLRLRGKVGRRPGNLEAMSAKPKAETKRLGEYRRKRSFDVAPEPEPGPDVARRVGDARFVVHEHHARRLHWDLRLEHEGALASWAVPNGIPEDPKHNRKAVHVEDHPPSYIDFQGTIPQGNCGAGEVTVWDQGTYTCEKWEPGKIVVAFQGEQLNGRYALFRAGRSEKDWMIHRIDPPADPSAEEMPDFIKPMLAKLSTLPGDDANWAYEVKWDGIRAITRSQPGRIHLFTR
jgi:DNA ligase D-like protein (predicted 3'-phosphoesterase)